LFRIHDVDLGDVANGAAQRLSGPAAQSIPDLPMIA
jgi:hypothetical protein